MVHPRPALPARARAGVVHGARWAAGVVQRVQAGGPIGPGCRGVRRRSDDPRHVQEGDQRRAQLQHDAYRGSEADRGSRRGEREVHRRDGQPLAAGSPRLGRSAAAAVRRLELLLQTNERSRRRRDVVRAEQTPCLLRRRCEGELRGRGGRGRGGAGTEGDRRVPAKPEEVHDARRPHPERRAAGGAPGNRQDAARASGRRRSEGSLLQPQWIRVRRNVRRRRRGARPRSVQSGRSEGAVHHLHRRARCARPCARAEPDGLA